MLYSTSKAFIYAFSYDALHGVAGAYAKHIFVEELGADESSLLNCVPKVVCTYIAASCIYNLLHVFIPYVFTGGLWRWPSGS
jgi:hypothetical protein